jgi:alkylhydroperoxidase family enzyme
MIYQDPDVARNVGEDPQSAPIPELHKAMFRLAKTFVQNSWEASSEEIETLRTLGASERDISEWLQIASIQTWFTHSADAGGIPLEGDAVTGPVLKHERIFYHEGAIQDREPISVAANGAEPAGNSWLREDRTNPSYTNAATWAEQRYGFAPGLFDALSACPDFYPRHQLALELLEGPQSKSLNPSLHALVRATVVSVDRCGYFGPTVTEMLRSTGAGTTDLEVLRESPDSHFEEPQTRVVLAFVQKMARHAFKITEADAEAFRAVGLGHEVYVDVFNTVAIQQSLDRLANCCGLTADGGPLLALERG